MANSGFMKWTTSEVDFYELLGITLEAFSESELRRAYRKTFLKYHPDKLGKDFDPVKYELFQAAHAVLKDAELKAKYDNHRNAKLLKQRANELFEGKRRQMKEDLEARERGDIQNAKRPREDHQAMLNKFAEEGRLKRAKREAMIATSSPAVTPQKDNVPFAPKPAFPKQETKEPKENTASGATEDLEDEVEVLERRIREAEAAKVKRKAEKKARKSGIFVPVDSPSSTATRPSLTDQDTNTPLKRPDILRGLKTDEKSSASPKFSFSPAGTPKANDFAATMARLKAAEKQRLEDEIRNQDTAEAQVE
ncbi:putative Pre-mRNA-splicing factor cwc23 [Calycina marina]|uniref:Pre-mRNA-splicing factor cwc23 n=1 Tax=Calycina marina TaxID=1763456 RepID=A0A9P7Z7Z2_9HELO|nr:putative Pre-mRNA-splicing factor cwc23 [Calycina marina]